MESLTSTELRMISGLCIDKGYQVLNKFATLIGKVPLAETQLLLNDANYWTALAEKLNKLETDQFAREQLGY